jgi:hypothetical protein
MKTVENRPCLCPNCGAALDRVTDPLGNNTPDPDDFTVCAECATMLRFNSDMTLRLITRADLEGLPPEFLKHLAAVRVAMMTTNKIMERKRPTGTKQ